MIHENRRISVEEVAGRLIHDSLKFTKSVPGGCLRN